MADFDSLIEDAENFQEEEDVDDDFVAEYNNEMNSKKRAADVDTQLDNIKKIKTPACLADYFVETVKPEITKSDARSINNSQPYSVTERNLDSRSTSQDASGDTTGPNCMCGISAISKTTLKEGPNKNRTFWICSNPRESQCKFFEWCDETKPPNNSAIGMTQATTGAAYQQKSQQPILTGPPCKCNLASIQRTTMKEGPNQGRNFWVCPAARESQCKFFEWENVEPKSTELSYGNKSNNAYNSNNGNSYGNNNNSQSKSQEGGGGGGGKGSCFRCGKEGHWSNNCPEAPQSGGGGGGGYNSNFNKDSSRGSFSQSNASYSNSQNSSQGGGGGGKGACFKCGDPGHWSGNCPKAGAGYRRN